MKRTFSVFLLFSLFAIGSVFLLAQTRPRRASDVRPGPAPSATTPARPPVLRGADRTKNPQPGNTLPRTTNDGPEEVDAGDVIKVNTSLVTLPVTVMDRDGKYVPNLRKEDFRLWEDGLEQEVAFFSSVDKPFSVVLMLDTSGSTRFRIEEIQDAAIAFVNQLRRDDRVMVVSFDDQIRVLTEFTSDRNRLRSAIMETETGDGTRLYDAVDLVMNERLSRVEGRKAVILFTDGVDTTSRNASYQSNVRDAEELDALIYPVQYDTTMDMGGGGSRRTNRRSVRDIFDEIFGPNGGINGGIYGGGSGRGGSGGGRSRGGRGGGGYDTASQYLGELAQRTGARTYQADSTQNLSAAFSNIAEELRRQYSLGYYPKNPAQAGQRRQIQVRVNQPNLAVRTRDTYVFKPAGTTADTAQRNGPVLQRNFGEDGGVRHGKLK